MPKRKRDAGYEPLPMTMYRTGGQEPFYPNAARRKQRIEQLVAEMAGEFTAHWADLRAHVSRHAVDRRRKR